MPITSKVSDEPGFAAVLGSAQAGDGAAFTTLFDAFGRTVAGYLRGRGVEDADGAANEVFLRVFTRMQHFEGDEAQFRSWLFTIARNLAVDEQRARARRATITAISSCVAQLTSRSIENDVVADRHVDDLLAMLTGDQRDVVLLRFVADLSIEQTAEVLGKPVSAVKALQHRALDALRKQLQQHDAVIAPAV
jgi:RNA polymerase sigma-70 factor (ECF subfamily)